MAFNSEFSQVTMTDGGGGTASILRVRTAELRDLASQYNSYKTNMIAESHAAIAQALSVVNNGWSGPTANDYLDRLTQMDRRIDSTIDRCYSNVSEALNYAADCLEQAEQNNRDSFANFGI